MTTRLTKRERETLTLIASGHNITDIAQAMRITERGAKFHLDSLREKFGVKHRFELVKIGQSYGKGTQ